MFSVTMYQQIPTDSLDQHLNHVTLDLMIFLCVGVLKQMLGAPVTFLKFADTTDKTDPLTKSILEDFSIPSSPMPRSILPNRFLSTDFRSSLHALLLVSGLFYLPSPQIHFLDPRRDPVGCVWSENVISDSSFLAGQARRSIRLHGRSMIDTMCAFGDSL